MTEAIQFVAELPIWAQAALGAIIGSFYGFLRQQLFVAGIRKGPWKISAFVWGMLMILIYMAIAIKVLFVIEPVAWTMLVAPTIYYYVFTKPKLAVEYERRRRGQNAV